MTLTIAQKNRIVNAIVDLNCIRRHSAGRPPGSRDLSMEGERCGWNATPHQSTLQLTDGGNP
ncbi:hypothetical protein [Pseudoduganella namucuonensis]|uniref:hypothetical protein n=1 Tax=Pseudoduganella namucuonensis TaxID=1035707 RepID=UPI001160D9E6|nr:hypothetical protein [Pseudoduganella namucuonensis]